MKIIIKELIEYFDIKASTRNGDTTALISVVGEDLNASIFKHYCENERNSVVKIYDITPTQMRKKGKWLDRWIFEKGSNGNILYQAEIKSFCSRAVGGLDIPLDIDKSKLDILSSLNWQHHLPPMISRDCTGVNKVLINMTNDVNLNINEPYIKEPLLIFWDARKVENEDSFFFKTKLPEKYFDYDYYWFFSCSLYLRYLYSKGIFEISLDMPNVERRVSQLTQLFKY